MKYAVESLEILLREPFMETLFERGGLEIVLIFEPPFVANNKVMESIKRGTDSQGADFPRVEARK
jgi:hypothetical protein